MKVVTPTALSKLIELIKTALSGKYDKTGGEITGNVKVDGNLILDIEDEDYDSGITFTKSLDNNVGTILTMTGYANANGINTNYKPVIRNVSDPINNYDIANKHYVDSKIVIPTSYLVALNNDGTIDQYSSSLTYSKVQSELTDYRTEVFLDVIYGSSRFHIPAVQDQDTNNGPLVFMGELRMPDGHITYVVFLLDKSNQLSVSYTARENALLKVTNLTNYSASESYYPSVKGVWDTFQRKPVTIWETSGSGLVGLDTSMSADPAWQLTNLDMTPFKRVKIYTRSAQKSGATASASTTPAVILEMSLDPRAAGPYGGHFIGSVVGQKPNDSNRFFTVTCAISADKTSFAVIRMTTLYGTAATSNSDVDAYVFKIEGYYD